MSQLTPEERDATPHAVYKMYDKQSMPLYIGCSTNPFGNRLRVHGDARPWIKEVALVKVEWYQGWKEGTDAETEAIAAENPKYNVARPTPRSAGIKTPFRGDGVHCPKCGTKIENKSKTRNKAYCNVCYREYTREIRKRKKLAEK